jgi:hypothetical protein
MFKFIIGTLFFANTLFAFSVFGGDFEINPHEKFSAGFRILIDSNIKDKAGVVDARVYFKDKKQEMYHFFAPMKCKGENCVGTIPVPEKYTKAINYIIVYQNTKGEIFKSVEFKMYRAEFVTLPKWQKFSTKRLLVKTELNMIPKQLYGFDDKVELQTVLKENKIGYKAEIYGEDFVDEKTLNTVLGSYKGELEDSEKPSEDPFKISDMITPDTVVGAGAAWFLLF